ncbi:MAG TPA: tetratricopeptide repeat protein [Bryobacteraceae bacterium]|nr:tetratricopeptide repeat protein [Bryobacteraceae bacterium]
MKSRLTAIAGCIFLLNTGYIAGFATPSVFYMANVLLHVALGLAIAAALIPRLRRLPPMLLAAAGLFLASAIAGAWLVYAGATRDHRWMVWLHIAFGCASVLTACIAVLTTRGPIPAASRKAAGAVLLISIAIPVSAAAYRKAFPNPWDRIVNPSVAPVSMAEEGAGPKSPFWPSSSNTNTGKIIPSNFFMDSKLCGECHKDIYEQWNSSMHHFASFNNQFYRKSIEYMQDVAGVKPTKWCAGCHDHAVFFNGRFERPIKDQIDTPEAQNGLGCLSCHAIVHVDSTMGNAGFVIEYPPLHELASSHNPIIRRVDRFLTYLDPEPHRRTMMKPFMREQSAEFCSACHKVHLDVPVNQYRWIRGFNDYDNWQASGVSGQGARSFYYPAKSQTCADCHMPLVASKDPGNINGQVHSHRFAAANAAVAFANRDERQLSEVEKFLKSGFITVDIFAASPVEEVKGAVEMRRRNAETPQLSSTFAVGEEAEQGAASVTIREVGKMLAPVETGTFQRGQTIRLDAVVRTRKIGHFFPAGTVDAFDVWLELQARDATGRIIFWSGKVEDNNCGPVERGAHFYRSYQLDGEGNMINKRNAFQTRSVLYVRLIPPGAADVAHFRLHIPKDAQGPITVTAKLNYRKFSHYYTQFAYAGQPKTNDPKLVSTSFDNREFSFDPANIPANVSGKIKGRIPVLPVITLAQAETRLNISDAPVNWTPVVRKADRERWNDWGIGLLLQGDLKGAEFAFKKVTEAEPEYADGWLNVARALIQEGETDAARPYIERSLAINDKLGRTWFFNAMIQKADGDYDGALDSLRKTAALYPRDRVVWNQIGRIEFLKRNYRAAEAALLNVLSVDPEDLQAHYTLMLVYRGLGMLDRAEREQKLFLRFKADESSQAITAKPRIINVEDNNERQPIHDHESVPLDPAPARRAAGISIGGSH